jgi:hypothetical protein
LWKPFAQQNHKKAAYELSSARSARCCSALLQNYGFSFALRNAKKLFIAKHQTNFPKRQRKNDNTTTVKKPNLLSNARIKPSFFQLLRSPHFPKRKTKKHSFFNLPGKRN